MNDGNRWKISSVLLVLDSILVIALSINSDMNIVCKIISLTLAVVTLLFTIIAIWRICSGK